MTPTSKIAQPSPGVDAYVPEWLTRVASRVPQTLDEPGCLTLHGAVLMADVSGFTRLAEQLRGRGAEGAEILWRQVDGYFGRMMQIIQSFGGEVQCFPGDAVIVLFEQQPGENPLRQAAACGLSLQQQLGSFSTDGDGVLRMRVALSAGAVQAAWVGGAMGRWEALLVSDALGDLDAALRSAAVGEVVVAASAVAGIPPDIKCAALAGGHRLLLSISRAATVPRLTAAPFSPEIARRVRPFIPQAVRERIDAGHSRWLAELRSLSVLIASVHGIHDAGAPLGPDILETLQRSFRAMQTAVYQFGGAVNLFLQDDKGIIMVAAWGLPGRTHEDDAVRAVSAARQMHGVLARDGFSLSVGIACGKVFCGQRGGAGRFEYGVLGAPVNLAGRLSGQIADGILCCSDVRHHARDRLRFTRGPELQLKGIDHPIQTWQPDPAARDHARAHRPIFGRDEELQRLAGLIDRLEQGFGGTVIIEGEPGVGKSCLVRAMGVDVVGRDHRLLRGAGDAIDRASAYHAFRGVFEELMGLEDTLTPARRHAAALAWLEGHPDVGELAPLFGPLLRVGFQDTPRTAAMVGQSRAETALDAFVAVLCSLERPVIVIDDIQWLDTASWQLLRAVRRELSDALFVLTTRPTSAYPSAAYSELNEDAEVEHMHLGPLDLAGIDALLRSRLEAAAIDPPLRDFIGARSGGLPFYAKEMAMTMLDAGLIRKDEGTCRLVGSGAGVGEFVLPSTLEGVVTSRIDRLSPTQQLVIKIASVVGRSFLADCVRDIYPVDISADQLAVELGALVSSDLIEVVSVVPTVSYRFKHVITQEIAYGLLLFEQRRSLHRAIAQWLKAGNAGDPSAYFPRIAWHWQRTGDSARAIDALEAAGEQAFGTFAEVEAIGFLSAALTLAEERRHTLEPRRLARWRRIIGEARMRMGQLEGALEHLVEANSLLGHPVPSSELGVGLRLMWEIGRQLSRHMGWSRPRSAPGGASGLDAVHAHLELSLMAYFLRKIPLVLYGGVRGLNLAQDMGPSPDLARALAQWAVIMSGLPLHDAAESYSLEALDIARRFDDRYSLGNAEHYRGVIHVTMGRQEAAIAILGEARENYDAVGNGRRVQEATNGIAFSALTLARYELVDGQRSRLVQVARNRGDQQALFWALIIEVELAWRRYEGPAVLARADESGSDDEVFVIRLQGLRVLLLVDAGDLDGAAEAVAPLEKLGRPTSFIESTGYFGRYRYALAAASAGRGTLRRARLRVRQMARFAAIFPYGEPLAALARAELAEYVGDDSRTRAACEACLSCCREMNSPWEQAHALGILSRISAGEEAARYAAEASAIAARIGVGAGPFVQPRR